MSHFETERMVFLKDTDAAGIVFFSRFFEFAHEAMEECLAEHELGIAKILAEGKYLCPVTHSECTFRSPLRLNDSFRLTGNMQAHGESGMRTEVVVFNQTTGKESALITIEQCVISADTWKEIALPAEIMKLLT